MREEKKTLVMGPGDKVRVKKSKHSLFFLQSNNRIGTVVIIHFNLGKTAYLNMEKHVKKEPWGDPTGTIPPGHCYFALISELKKIK